MKNNGKQQITISKKFDRVLEFFFLFKLSQLAFCLFNLSTHWMVLNILRLMLTLLYHNHSEMSNLHNKKLKLSFTLGEYIITIYHINIYHFH